MRLRQRKNIGIQPQRGFWLRCFLGAIVLIALPLGGERAAMAQLDTPGPEHLTHVEGLVVNTTGQPVANVEVALVRDDKVARSTRTNDAGAFRFDHVSGRYSFTVARTQYAPAAREIVVTEEVVTRVERKKLYVILGPGACADACSTVLTSKREFEKEIKNRNQH